MHKTLPQPPRVTVSGSFRRSMTEVQAIVHDFTDAGMLVLSPADPRVVGSFGDFVFVASDRVRHLRTVQARHLAAIAASDFLWLVAPDGYVGQSAAMEIGFAAAHKVPIYCEEVPSDLTLRQWVRSVSGPAEALCQSRRPTSFGASSPTILVDPGAAIEAAHKDLVVIHEGLLGKPTPVATQAAEQAVRRIQHRLLLP
jgi:hypothetical protein